ncbi:hypothetical protein INT44_001563 [Umbelopsis vinacea]|uniref:Uncharacterized protein n=1 Tax=Umbelopsis vinacea TaxID=44442 RepID=A0A8H7PSG0_9FUNG|nr:hypothetical protein INT44_001563 [Umbelopsis vinacea]
MGDGKSKTLHKITRWGSASNSGSSTRTGGGAHAAGNQPLTLVEPLDPEDLKQGQLYIVKISLVKLALFEGDESKPMRWSEARYLPGDFYAYEAFDEAGNPPVYIWQRLLNTDIPPNWFSMFEEARRKQREWETGFDQVHANGPTYQLTDYHATNEEAQAAAVGASDDVVSEVSNQVSTGEEREKLRDFLVGEQPQRGNSINNASNVENSAPHSPVPSHISQIPVAAPVDGKYDLESVNGFGAEKAGQTQAKYDDDSIDFPHDQLNFSIPDYPTTTTAKDTKDRFRLPATEKAHRPSVKNILKSFKQHDQTTA